MKNTFGLIFIILLAIPAFAQDEGEGGPEGGGEFLGGEGLAPSGRGVSTVDPLADVRTWLTKAGAPPIEKKQEKPLRKLYDREVKAMAKSFEKRFGVSMETALAAQSPARGRRGSGTRTASPEQTAELRRLTDRLSDKVTAGLRLDQQAALRRYQSEQLRVKRVNLIKQKFTAAGFSLTPDQETQIDGLYARESRLRTLLIIDAKGEPYDKTIASLEKQTTQRVVQLLNQTQKAVLSAAVSKSKAP